MPIQFHHTTLPNGLTVIAETNPDAHTAAAGFFVKTGSRDEALPLMGVSHFLEHMMFKGTARRSAADVNRDFDRIGANYNASTSQEVTMYYAHVLPELLGDSLDILCDILRPALREEDFEMEKKVILEEIGMYADRPFWIAYEQAMENFFGPHPLGYRILGTIDSITALSASQMRDYFEHRYSPDNIVVSLAGKLDFDRAVEQVDEACGNWPRTGARREYPPIEPRCTSQTLEKSGMAMRYMVGVSPAPGAQDDSRYAAAVLAQVLGDSDGSRLYWKLIDPGLAEEAELEHHPYDGVGAFMFTASYQPDRAQQVEEAFNGVLAGAGEGLSDEEVGRSVSKLAMDLTLQNERPAGRMMALGGQWVYLNRYVPLAEELSRLQAVNAAELRALLEQYPFDPRAVVKLSPG